MRNLKMIVAYVGTGFAGWQVQPGRPTIQGVLEDRIARLLQEKTSLAGAGRTDAGVHARGQVANFLTERRIPPDGLLRGVNARLPPGIAIMRVEEADAGFHARADARWKEYRYRIARAAVVSPFDAPFVAVVRGRLDVSAMRLASRALEGTHDFTSFCAADTRVESKVRRILRSEIEEHDGCVEYRVRADGFLRHMVRTLAGTLIQVGQGRIDAAAIPAIIAARDRRAAGPCATARGLTLETVSYAEEP